MKKVFANTPPQSFIIDEELLEHSSPEDVEATWRVLTDLKLNAPPYNHFDIIIKGCILFRMLENGVVLQKEFNRQLAKENNKLEDYQFTLRYDRGVFDVGAQTQHGWPHIYSMRNDLKSGPVTIWRGLHGRERATQFEGSMADKICQSFYRLLIVLLATRGVKKERTEDKLRKFGIKKGGCERYKYSTRISLDRIALEPGEGEELPAGHTGRHLRPHLRRAHIRRQHYGPKNQLEKSVLIESVFVNADPDFVLTRTHYNVGK